MNHTECVANTESVLIGLSEVADVPYIEGDFSRFEDEFVNSGQEEARFTLKEGSFEVSVLLEKYEGYFFVSIVG
ncbi:hypothetical protein MJO52_08160 [Microbulbifer variabilis]|uniref:Uncharacterized protein n=1 Tax=Microbulbifer variabilis TaxID=266805 RepID=A0ABY4VFL2_9GAMM|nr:hypothetical protein [Microbulbifer variabilis]USD23095.1 hypothetical protein MJO52_08160 [Microbulbifer variabilis]